MDFLGEEEIDWFDPSAPAVPDELLNGIGIENLRRPNGYYSGYIYSNFGNRQTRDLFWKPWWSK